MDQQLAAAVGQYLETCLLLAEGTHVVLRYWRLYKTDYGERRPEWLVSLRLRTGASVLVRAQTLLGALEQALTHLHAA